MDSLKNNSPASRFPKQKSMLRTWLCFLVWGALLPAAPAAEESFTPLFDGRSLDAWAVPQPNPWWRVEAGVLVGENDPQLKGHTLYTKQAYGDFVLEAEVKWEGEIDSGFMLRKPELQLQIGVSRSLKRDLTGSFYTGGQERYPEAGQAKGLEEVLKPGAWNTFRLQAQGDLYTVWINGKKVTEYRNPKYKDPGPIGLQIHGGLKMRVDFRNVRVRAL